MTLTRQVLAIDAGGTHVRMALIDSRGGIMEQTKARINFSKYRAETSEQTETYVVKTLADSCASIFERQPDIGAVGIGFPGFFIENTGVLAASPNIPMLQDFPLAARLSEQLGKPVYVQNDALMAAVGEFRFGAGKNAPSLLHLTLGTGIGGGLILDGKPYPGEGGMAMEIGHLCLMPGGRPCGCGSKGCLEAYASATAIAARYHEASGQHLDASQIHALAVNGDTLADHILQDAGAYLGQAIAGCIKLLDVRLVTISGGLTGAWELLHPHIASGLESRLLPPQRGKIQVRKTMLGDNAGLFGAAATALQA
ncbi:MAG: ROK family protein [Mariprofundaceae bacterium]